MLKKLWLSMALISSYNFGMMQVMFKVPEARRANFYDLQLVYRTDNAATGTVPHTSSLSATRAIDTHKPSVSINIQQKSTIDVTQLRSICQQYFAYTEEVQRAEIASIAQAYRDEMVQASLMHTEQKITRLRYDLALLETGRIRLMSEINAHGMELKDAKLSTEQPSGATHSNVLSQEQVQKEYTAYAYWLELKKIDVQIAAHKQALEQYEKQMAQLEAKIIQDFKLVLEKMDTKALITIEIPKIKNEMQQLETLLAKRQQELKRQQDLFKEAQKKVIESESTWKNRLGLNKVQYRELVSNQQKAEQSIIDLQQKISSCKKVLHEAKLRLVCAESTAKQRAEVQLQRMEGLKQLKENLITIKCDDKQVLTALDRAIADKGSQKVTAYNVLRTPEESLLAELKLPAQDFRKMDGDAFQHCLFNKTNSILYTTALRGVQHTQSPELKKLLDTTARMCHVVVGKINHGTPQEAHAAFSVVESLHDAADLMISSARGLAQGSMEGLKANYEVLSHPIDFVTNSATGIIKMASMLDGLNEFNPAMLDKAQVEEVVTRTDAIAQSLNSMAKEISAMSAQQVAEKAGVEAGKIMADIVLFNAGLRVAGTAGKLSLSQAKSVLGKMGTIERVATAQKAVVAAEKNLAVVIEIKNTEIDRAALRLLPDAGQIVGGRYYTRHALERMAPPTPEIIEQLKARAIAAGYVPGSDEFKKYIQPRNILPCQVEDVIKRATAIPGTGKYLGSLVYEIDGYKIITNLKGDVITVFKNSK